jgi:hypothetical protein
MTSELRRYALMDAYRAMKQGRSAEEAALIYNQDAASLAQSFAQLKANDAIAPGYVKARKLPSGAKVDRRKQRGARFDRLHVAEDCPAQPVSPETAHVAVCVAAYEQIAYMTVVRRARNPQWPGWHEVTATEQDMERVRGTGGVKPKFLYWVDQSNKEYAR